MLTSQTRATLVQVLQSISPDAVRLLLLKHLDQDLWPVTTHALLELTANAASESVAGLLVELLSGNTAVRAEAPTKYVFDGRLADLRARLRADGFEVIEDGLLRIMPSAESAAKISDGLEQLLTDSDLDPDGKLRRLLRESYESIAATPPDLNGSTTKARIALETIVRRAAAAIARRRGKQAPSDSWGAALQYLRSEAVLAPTEEEAIAKVYTLISPGAHVPKGLTDEQWALVARTFAVSGAYFIAHQYLAA